MRSSCSWEQLIAPVRPEEFLTTILGRRFAHIAAAPDRPILLTWEELNDALLRLRVVGDRVRMFRNGVACPEESYLSERDQSYGAVLRTVAVRRMLREGATLNVNQVSDLFDPVRDVVESLATTFRTGVSSNMYLGFGHDRGFDIHWDTHDTLITQVFGRKHWRVFEPTRRYPLRAPNLDDLGVSTARPVLDSILGAGDTLYLPRGWWHVVTPIAEPSLHITFGIKHPTGVDLLMTTAAKMASCEEARRDLPLFASSEQRSAYIELLLEQFARLLCGNPVEAYYDALERKVEVQLKANLPGDVMSPANASTSMPLVLAETRRLSITVLNEEAIFVAAGKEWRVDRAHAAALRELSNMGAKSIPQLLSIVPPHERINLYALLAALVTEGVLVPKPS